MNSVINTLVGRILAMTVVPCAAMLSYYGWLMGDKIGVLYVFLFGIIAISTTFDLAYYYAKTAKEN